MFSIILEKYCSNKTIIYYHGKGAIDNQTTTKCCTNLHTPWYMKFRISPHNQVLLFLNSVNLRSNGLNPLLFLWIKSIVSFRLLLAESNGKVQNSDKEFPSQEGLRNSLWRKFCVEGVSGRQPWLLNTEFQ